MREEVGETALRHGEGESESGATDGSGDALRADFRATRGPTSAADETIGATTGVG